MNIKSSRIMEPIEKATIKLSKRNSSLEKKLHAKIKKSGSVGTSRIDLLAYHASDRRGTHTHHWNHKSPGVMAVPLCVDRIVTMCSVKVPIKLMR